MSKTIPGWSIMGHRGLFLQLVSLIALYAVVGGVSPAEGQVPSQFGDYDVVGAAYHKFVLPGESSIQVLVLADGGATGVYELGRHVDVGELFALSSATLGAITPREKREVTLRLYRERGGNREVIYRATMEEFLSFPGQYPQLQDRDVMVVETVVKQRFGWRDALTIVTGVAAVSLAVDRFRRVAQ